MKKLLEEFHRLKRIRIYNRIRYQIGNAWSCILRFLGSPHWQGISAIVTIALTVAIFILARQIDESRYEQTLANINLIGTDFVAFQTPEGNTTNQWMMTMQIQNSGPATAKEFVISLAFGGAAVTPAGSPKITSNYGDTSFQVLDQGQGTYKIDVDRLFAYDQLLLTQNFSVQEPENSEWRDIIINPHCFTQGQVRICAGGYMTFYQLENGQQMVALGGVGPGPSEFIKEIKVIGDNTRQGWSWPTTKS